MEGSSLKLDVIQKVPEIVVNERMSQDKRVTKSKDKKKVPGWSTEEMMERPNFAEEEDTEEMKRWRSLGEETGGGSPGQVQSRGEQEREEPLKAE